MCGHHEQEEQDDASASDGGVCSLAGFLAGLCPFARWRRHPPTVTYVYSDEEDYDDIEARADLYCEEQYDADAVLADQDADDAGYKAVFACR